MSLSTNAVEISTNSLEKIVYIETNNPNAEVSVSSNKPDIIEAVYYSNVNLMGQRVAIRAQDSAGTAVISVQVLESKSYEASPVQTITVGNYAFGALNTCTPAEIQACAQLGIAPVTWAVGDNTADIPIAKFTVGGTASRYWSKGAGAYKLSYTAVKTYASNGHAKLIGINHNSGKEGNNRLHFMYWGGTWLEPFIDKKHYGKVVNRGTPYSGSPSASAATSDYDYSFARAGTNWELNNNVRKNFLPNFLEAMDSAWRRVLADCPKYTPANDFEGAEGYTNDKAFILSEYEVFGENPYQHADYLHWNAHRAEANWQAQYDYFKSGIPGAVRDGKVDERGLLTMIPCDWLLRSLSATTEIKGNLGVSGEDCSEIDVTGGKSIGIVPCFVIA